MNCRRALRDIPVFNVTEQRNAIVVSGTILTMVHALQNSNVVTHIDTREEQ